MLRIIKLGKIECSLDLDYAVSFNEHQVEFTAVFTIEQFYRFKELVRSDTPFSISGLIDYNIEVLLDKGIELFKGENNVVHTRLIFSIVTHPINFEKEI